MDPSLLQRIQTHQLTVNQLKQELRARNAKTSGNKAELEIRLRDLLVGPTSALQFPSVPTSPPGQPPVTQLGTLKVRFPPVPTAEPGAPTIKEPSKFKAPTGPVSPRRSKIPEQEALPEPEITRITNLIVLLTRGQINTDQQKAELNSVGLITTGAPETIRARLWGYLNSIRLTKVSRWPLCIVETKTGGDIGFVFDLFWQNTTEQIMHGIRPGDWITFYDNDKHTYHPVQVAEVIRSQFGLTHEIRLTVPRFSIRRIKGFWRMIQETAFGPTAIDGSIAAHLKMV